MLTLVRAGVAAALIALALVPAAGQDATREKAFQSAPLDEAAVKLEAQIKTDAGTVTKPAAQLRKDADAAFQKNDFRAGMLVLGQLVSVAPDDGANWLRLARTHPPDQAARRQGEGAAARPRRDRGLHRLPARQGPHDRGRQPHRARRYARRRSASGARRSMRMRIALEQRESADLRGRYERLRLEHGFRMLDYSVDSDAASPRACFQFSETLPARAPISRRSSRCSGRTARRSPSNEKQLCVEGLKHGERYQITLRAGLPSTVHENAAEVGRVHDLRARPQAVRALLRQGLRAAAHRPARHSGPQRQHVGGDGRGLPHRRPQPDRHRARLRLPAQSLALSGASRSPPNAARRCGAASSRSSRSSTPR